MRPLGDSQQWMLDALRKHGRWSRNCGWLWDTPSGTERILDSLVRRGLARKRWVKERPPRPPYQRMEYVPVEGK